MSRIWLDIVCGERRCQDEHGRVCCHWHYNHGACMCELFGPLRTPAQLCDGGTPIRAEQCIRQTLPAHGPRPDARSEAIAQALLEQFQEWARKNFELKGREGT